jgi:DNA-binding SARP family transcriptional activator
MSEILQLRFLGHIDIRREGVSVTGFHSRKVQALFCYLAVTGQPHLRPVLAELLWGELSEAHANTNLRKALTNLRRQLPGWLTITRQTVAFNPEKLYQLDVADFEAKAVDGLAQARLDWLEEAVALYQGDFLVGFQVRAALAFEEWVRAKQSQLRELAIQTLDALAGHYPTQGEAGQALALTYTRQLLTLEPWREEAHRHLMRLLALTNQRSAALAQYELCRQVLAAEFGVEPGPETTALYEQLRTGLLTQESLAADGQTNDRPIFQPLNPAAPPTRYNLPAEPTPFIGRELELRALGPIGTGWNIIEINTAIMKILQVTLSAANGINKRFYLAKRLRIWRCATATADKRQCLLFQIAAPGSNKVLEILCVGIGIFFFLGIRTALHPDQPGNRNRTLLRRLSVYSKCLCIQ